MVVGDATLNHFVAPLIAGHDEGGEVAAAEAKRAEPRHDYELQQQRAHDRHWKKGHQTSGGLVGRPRPLPERRGWLTVATLVGAILLH